MSDAKEAPKKKKLPLPMIIAVVAVLGGGGYFAMKPKDKPKPKVADVVLGETADLGEFTTPLSDGKTFFNVEIKVVLEKGKGLSEGGGEEKKGADPGGRNAVLKVLKTVNPKDIETSEGLDLLKEKIAWQINHDVNILKKYSGKPEEDDGSKKHKKGEADPYEAFKHVDRKDRDEPELDSDLSPVRLVYITKFLPIDYGSQ